MINANSAQGTNGTGYNVRMFEIWQQILRVRTLTICQVVAVQTAGKVAPVGRLTVRPLVQDIDGSGKTIDTANIYNVPYLRAQAGTNALIIDPKPGDIGLVGFCQRDIAAVKETLQQSPPESARAYDYSDAVYLMTVLAVAAPERYILLDDSGIEIVGKELFSIKADSVEVETQTAIITSMAAMDIECPAINIRTGIINVDGLEEGAEPVINVDGYVYATDVYSNNHSGANHTHPLPGGGNTGGPQ